MNKHLYRVIFNKYRGIRMAVQETASSAGKARNTTTTQPASAPAWGPLGALGYKPLAAALALWLGSPAGFAQIIPDRSAPGTQRPTVLNSANGTPTVHIQTPSQAGVSRNTYQQFDIGAKGAILNNSRSHVQSQLGGGYKATPGWPRAAPRSSSTKSTRQRNPG